MERKQYEFVMTEQHKQLLQNIMPVMEAFYGNELLPILEDVERAYHAQPYAARDTVDLIKSLSITCENQNMKQQVQNLRAMPYQSITPWEENTSLNVMFRLTNSERKALSKVLDTYSRIMMGQLSIIFEALDIQTDGKEPTERQLQAWHDAYWEGGMGLRDAKAQLLPDTAEFGWNGGYGICNQKVALGSRLAYEMRKILDKEKPLKVTDVSLPRVEVIKYRTAL